MATPMQAPGANTALVQQQISAYQARVRSAANWFIIIGALSVINTLLAMGGGRLHFIFGLGVTSVVDAIARQSSSSGMIPLLVSVLFAGFISVFGVLGRKEQRWAFFVGMGAYLCDGLLLLPAGLYLDAAFHAWGLFRIFQGLQALSALERLRGQAMLSSTGAVSGSWQQ